MSLEFMQALCSTRHTRELQRVEVKGFATAEAAGLAGKLMGTDPTKQWSLTAAFECDDAMAVLAAILPFHYRSSLTALDVSGDIYAHIRVVHLLTAFPSITHFRGRLRAEVCLFTAHFCFLYSSLTWDVGS